MSLSLEIAEFGCDVRLFSLQCMRGEIVSLADDCSGRIVLLIRRSLVQNSHTADKIKQSKTYKRQVKELNEQIALMKRREHDKQRMEIIMRKSEDMVHRLKSDITRIKNQKGNLERQVQVRVLLLQLCGTRDIQCFETCSCLRSRSRSMEAKYDSTAHTLKDFPILQSAVVGSCTAFSAVLFSCCIQALACLVVSSVATVWESTMNSACCILAFCPFMLS